jgi:signal transduction histidine kinase
MESFHRAGRFLASILNIGELLHAILEEALAAVQGTRGFVGLVNRSTGDLEIRITAGQGWEAQTDRSIPITAEPGHGISIWVAASGVPYVTGDVRNDPNYLMYFPDVRSEIAVPLVNRDGRTIGVLNVESETVDAFNLRDLQLLLALASQASIAISVANYRAREATLIEIGNELATSEDLDAVLRVVANRSAELLRAEDCSIFELCPDGEYLALRASSGMLAHRVDTLYRVSDGITGWIARKPEPVRVDSVIDDPRWSHVYPELPPDSIESYLGVPVFRKGKLWGVLRVLRRKPASSVVTNEFTPRDEVLLTTLARQLGAAITRHHLTEQQLQMERMAAWGEMSARSAHMIGNKVFALKGQLNELEYLSRQPDFGPKKVLDVVERAKTGVFRLEEILTEFRDFLMATHLDRKPVDLNDLVKSTVAEAFPHVGPVSISVDLAPDLPKALVDAAKLRRAISELLENAATHQPNGGEIRVVTGLWGDEERERSPQVPYRSEWSRAGAVRIEVSDRGPGVPAESKDRIFAPFYTTRSKGMGLGLSIVKGIIDAHQGAIMEIGEPGQGAHFAIVLPAAPPDVLEATEGIEA